MSDFDKILIGAIIGAALTVATFFLQRHIQRRDARRANSEALFLLRSITDAVSDDPRDLKNPSIASADYTSGYGIWYKNDLADLLKDTTEKLVHLSPLLSDEDQALCRDAVFRIIRISGMLRSYSMKPDREKLSFESDEIIFDEFVRQLLLAIDPLLHIVIKDADELAKEKERYARMRKFYFHGLEFNVPVMPPKPKSAKTKDA